MNVREHATDHRGLPLAPGLSVRVLAEAGQPAAQVVRIVGDYDAVTVVLEGRTGRMERMYPCADVELVVSSAEQKRRSVA
jgi:hypothetical protein